MSRSSFGQPPSPQVGMAAPKGAGMGPMSSPKMGPGVSPAPMAPSPMAPQAPPPGMGAQIAGAVGRQAPSMFRRPRY